MESNPLDRIRDPKLRQIFEKHPTTPLPESTELPAPSLEGDRRSDDEILEAVLGRTGDNEKELHTAIEQEIAHVKDKARRTHLWAFLQNKSTERIRRARRSALT